MTKTKPQEGSANIDNSASNNIFGKTLNNRRRLNVNLERTLDFIGIGSNLQANNTIGGNNPNLLGLSRTLHASSMFGSNKYQSAAMAMESDVHAGIGRQNSIFGLPNRQNSTFHARHNSEDIKKTDPDQNLEGLGDSKFESFDGPTSFNKRLGKTFDERAHKRSVSMYSTYDQSKIMQQNTLKNNNNSSFSFASSTFHFRRTVSKVPSFMRRQKLSRQLSIQKNAEQIRRNSSLENIVT